MRALCFSERMGTGWRQFDKKINLRTDQKQLPLTLKRNVNCACDSAVSQPARYKENNESKQLHEFKTVRIRIQSRVAADALTHSHVAYEVRGLV